MTWRENPMAGLDSESTGLDVETVEIVTACVGWADPQSGVWSPVTWLLRPVGDIPAEATAVHGITTEQARDEGMDHKTGLSEIRDALHFYWGKGWPVCGYNLVYDLTLLDRELRRHGLGPLAIGGPVLDGLVIDKQTDRYRKGSRKLVDTAAHYGIPLSQDDAHGAEADALAATRLAWVLAPRVPQQPEEAMLWQAKAYREQRVSFGQHLRGQGKHDEADDVLAHTTWPLEPAPTRKVA